MKEFDPTQFPMIEKMAKAIQKHEGWKVGSRSFRNNNPGNLVCTEYVKKYLGAIGCEKGGRFAVFRNYDEGFFALELFIFHAATDQLRSYRASMTIPQYFAKYAPSADNNNPAQYAAAVLLDLDKDIKFRLLDLLKTENEAPQAPEVPAKPEVEPEAAAVVVNYTDRPKGTSRREWFAKITGLPREMYNKVFKSADTQKIDVKDLDKTIPEIAQTVAVEDERFEIYVVQKGDSLSKIALALCGDVNDWPQLLAANKSEIESASLIFVGQKLKIPKSLLKK